MLCYRVAVLFAIFGSVLSSRKPFYDLADAEEHFTDFIAKYDRHYKNAEEHVRRFEIFLYKLIMINYWNEIYEATFDVNQFADQDHLETGTGYFPSKEIRTRKLIVEKEWIKNAPSSLDYRTLGLVTDVKDQGRCFSCYIFSAIGNIEGQNAKLTGTLLSLSDQEALDCAGQPCNKGGDQLKVMRKLSQQDGLMTQADYPYETKQGECRTDKSKVKVKVTSADNYATPDEEALKGVLAELGPVSISLHVSPSMQHYRGGDVFKPTDCQGEVNHAVLLVGYSTDKDGTPYWIIKNSWGSEWGEQGYLLLEMGIGHCSILVEGVDSAKVALPYFR